MRPLIVILWAGIVLLAACSGKEQKTPLTNQNASLPALLKFSTAGLKMMTSFVDKRSGSMSVLYTRGDTRVLVTWKQQSDDNWFGANIPGKLLSVEMVTASQPGQLADYKSYNDKGLLTRPDTALQRQRVSYILGQQPSVMP